jgi:LuxR family transcriptional regulator, maltose regulon positive regulatory protein
VAVRAAAHLSRPAPQQAPRAAVPAPPPATVRRERLEDRLDRLADRAVTVVTGPAGSGKTVLLGSWAARRGAAWVSLRAEHLHAARLWADIAAALRAVGIELGPAPTATGASTGEAAAALRAALGPAPRRATLVLDDVHLLRGPALALVGALAAECGDALGLAVASRSDPDLGLGRMRVEGRLGELRGVDLAFTSAEARALLAAHGLSLRDDQIARVVARTEGWAAGLRLAALSLRAEPDADEFLAAFAGDDHAVADYLSGEVLALQRPAVREFLLRTSIVERVCGGLADALTGERDGARTLVELHRSGLLVAPMDRHERWFRYHPLFAELLRARLRIDHPGLTPQLHLRAARWLAANGLGREALPHALDAGDPAAVTELLADQWLDLLLGGQAPDAVLAAARLRPADRRLSVAAAGVCLEAGDTGGAAAVLAPCPPGDARDDVGALAQLLRARAAGDAPGARRAAAGVLGHRGGDGRLAVPVDDARRSLALLHLGITEFVAGSPDAAADALEAASALAVDARRERVQLECLGRSAALELVAGRLTRAATSAAAALSLARVTGSERAAPCAWAHAALAAVHWLRDELSEAEASTDAAITVAYAAADVPAAHVVKLLRGHLLAARGDAYRGRALVRAVLDGGPAPGPVVSGWHDALGPCPWGAEDDEDPPDPLATAALRLARGDTLSALRRVEGLLAPGQALHPTRRLHAWLIAAVARQALGRTHDASEAVERALEIAAPEHYRRPFADGGGAVRRLLQRHASLPTAYAPVVAELIDALESASAPPPGLLEPLSDRERDVLRLLPTLLPNTEIAGELFVSVNTVKTHVKSIYRKLEVSSRREAVARARQLRLI